MRRLIKIAIILAGMIGGLLVARFVVWKRAPELIERMMEDAMPQMMSACFAQMSQERREFMLGHCRGLLDQMDLKYGVTGSPEHVVEADTMPVDVA